MVHHPVCVKHHEALFLAIMPTIGQVMRPKSVRVPAGAGIGEGAGGVGVDQAPGDPFPAPPPKFGSSPSRLSVMNGDNVGPAWWPRPILHHLGTG